MAKKQATQSAGFVEAAAVQVRAPKKVKAKAKAPTKRPHIQAPDEIVDEPGDRVVVPGQRSYTTPPLQPRHADFLERIAAMEGRTPEQMLERLVRIAYSRDPNKGGRISNETSTGGFSGKAADLKRPLEDNG